MFHIFLLSPNVVIEREITPFPPSPFQKLWTVMLSEMLLPKALYKLAEQGREIMNSAKSSIELCQHKRVLPWAVWDWTNVLMRVSVVWV